MVNIDNDFHLSSSITHLIMESVKTSSADMMNSETGEDKARAKFGTRYLTDPQNVFQHNAWDNAVWDEEQEAAAQKIAINHATLAASLEKKDEYEREAGKNWDQFYKIHTNHFFKDRHWLFTEFPELNGQGSHPDSEFTNTDASLETSGTSEHCKSSLVQQKEETISSQGNNVKVTEESLSLLTMSESHSFESVEQPAARIQFSRNSHFSFRLLEVGCGVGNTVFPVLKTNKNTDLFIYCCDFSSAAIDIVKAHPDYDQKRCHAFVHDVTADKYEVPFPLESLDIIIMIFVLSAITPEKMQGVVDHLASYLKPGGTLLFRDYGRYDMAQLRFKQGRCLSENFYVRGDGTRVYFFTQDELRSMFVKAGLQEKENIVDRRLQVNRGRQIKMYRVWIQCKYIKPL